MNCREIKYLIFVLIALLAGCAEDGGDQDIAFVKFFGEGNNDYGVDVYVHNQIIYVLANVGASDSTEKQIPCLYFLNLQGEFIQEPLKFNIDTIENENAEKLLMDDDRNIYIVSNVYTSDSAKIYIRKIKNREIIWENSFGDKSTRTLATDALISENEIVIVGSTENSLGNKNPCFLKVNTEGEFLVLNNKGGGDNSDDEYLKIIKSNSRYFITGYTKTWGVSATRKQSVILVETSSEGGKVYGDWYGASRINEGLCLTLQGNSIILASNELSTDGGAKQLKVYGIDKNNFLVNWETEFVEAKNIVPTDIFAGNDGFIVASSKFSGTAGNICLFSYDIDGNYLGKKELGSNRLDATLLKVNRMIALDGEFFIIGNNEFGGNSDVALLKLNSSNDFFE